MKDYKNEAFERWGDTDSYREHTEKTKGYTKQKWEEVNNGLEAIFTEFALCKSGGVSTNSEEAFSLVSKLQKYITDNYYTCTKDILWGLGKMYVADERFKNNIDKNGVGTAEYVSLSIDNFCRMI